MIFSNFASLQFSEFCQLAEIYDSGIAEHSESDYVC
jgi:hypothetical protein